MKWRRNKKAWTNRYHIHRNMISLCLYFLCRPVSKKFFAGAGATDYSARGGALTFLVDCLPSFAWWNSGSALCWCEHYPPTSWGGALTFDVNSPPWAYWGDGSAR